MEINAKSIIIKVVLQVNDLNPLHACPMLHLLDTILVTGSFLKPPHFCHNCRFSWYNRSINSHLFVVQICEVHTVHLHNLVPHLQGEG